MSTKHKRFMKRKQSFPYWSGTSRHKAKGKALNGESGRRMVPLETVFNHPSWNR
jgi:hypothetical protein